MKIRSAIIPYLHGSGQNMTALIIVGAGMMAAAVLKFAVHLAHPANVVLIVAVVVASVPLFIDLAVELFKRNFSVDLLAALSIGTAALLHQYWVAGIVVLMLAGGKSLEAFATRRASSVLGALAKRMPRVAHRIELDGAVCDIDAVSIQIGDQIVLYPHELCPVDGTVLAGNGSMDESFLTGEPFLISKIRGAAVLSGAINGDAALTIGATKLPRDSRYAKIVEVLHASEERRPQMRRLGDRLGSWYTPVAVALAVVSWAFSGSPERFLAVLVIATPCPLLIAIPVAIVGAISVGARHGIVIKDPSILEKLQSCRSLIVDKTGTLTYGKPTLTHVIPLGSWPRSEILRMAATLEFYSKHPLASAVVDAADQDRLMFLNAEDVSESPGNGLTGHVEGHAVTLTGRGKLAPELASALPAIAAGLECVVLIDSKLAGLLRFQDEPRKESRPFLAHLDAKHDFREIVLLSGDRPAEVSHFASRMGITSVFGGMSPEQKVEIVRKITARGPTLYLGDGINDAPAMLNATAGVALGVNSEITSEAAGAVILQGSLTGVDELIHIGARLRRIALTSAVGGVGLSVAGMCAAAAGYISPIQGALLQEIIDVVSILNSLRIVLPAGPLSDFEAPGSNTVPDSRLVTSRVVGA